MFRYIDHMGIIGEILFKHYLDIFRDYVANIIDDYRLRDGSGSTRRPLLKLAAALSLAGLSACTATIPVGTSLRDGAPTRGPAGWADFCRRNTTDPSCDARPLDKQSWNELQNAQNRMRAIVWADDSKNFGKSEYWQVAVKSGDCEDLSLAARQRLLDLGWPVRVLRLASVFTETHQMHSVLTVEVIRDGHRETLVLDSRRPDVTSWDRLADLGYWFVVRQSASGSAWVKIDGGQGRGWKQT